MYFGWFCVVAPFLAVAGQSGEDSVVIVITGGTLQDIAFSIEEQCQHRNCTVYLRAGTYESADPVGVQLMSADPVRTLVIAACEPGVVMTGPGTFFHVQQGNFVFRDITFHGGTDVSAVFLMQHEANVACLRCNMRNFLGQTSIAPVDVVSGFFHCDTCTLSRNTGGEAGGTLNTGDATAVLIESCVVYENMNPVFLGNAVRVERSCNAGSTPQSYGGGKLVDMFFCSEWPPGIFGLLGFPQPCDVQPHCLDHENFCYTTGVLGCARAFPGYYLVRLHVVGPEACASNPLCVGTVECTGPDHEGETCAAGCVPGAYPEGRTCLPCANNTLCSGQVLCKGSDHYGESCPAGCVPRAYVSQLGVCEACVSNPLCAGPVSCTGFDHEGETCAAGCVPGAFSEVGVCTACASNQMCSGAVNCTGPDHEGETCAAGCVPGAYDEGGRCLACTKNPLCSGPVDCSSSNHYGETCPAGCVSYAYVDDGLCLPCASNPLCAGTVQCTGPDHEGETCAAECVPGAFSDVGICTACARNPLCGGTVECTGADHEGETCPAGCVSGAYDGNGRCEVCAPNDLCVHPPSCDGPHGLGERCDSCIDGALRNKTCTVHVLFLAATPSVVKQAGGDHVTITGSGFIPGHMHMLVDGVMFPVVEAASFAFTTQPSAGGYARTCASVDFGKTCVASSNKLLFYSSAPECMREGFYQTTDGECIVCPPPHQCPGGNRIWPAAGYWSEAETFMPRPCAVAAACPGALGQIPGYPPQYIDDAQRNTSLCTDAYTGILCAQCSANHYQAVNSCETCGFDEGDRREIYTRIAILCVLFALLSTVANFCSDQWFDRILIGSHHAQHFLALGWLNGVAINGSFSEQLYFDLSFLLFKLNFVKASCSYPPIRFVHQYWGTMAVFFGFAVLFVLTAGLRAFIFMRKSGAWKSWWHRSLRALLALGWILYLPMTILNLRAVDCIHLDGRDGQALLADPAQECYSGQHAVSAPFMWIALVLFTFGFPVACFFFAWKIATSPLPQAENPLASMFGFTVRGLRPSYYWFRSVDFACKLIFAFNTVLLRTEVVHVLVALVVFVVDCLGGIVLHPMVSNIDTAVVVISGVLNGALALIYLGRIAETAVLMASMLLLFCAIVIASMITWLRSRGRRGAAAEDTPSNYKLLTDDAPHVQ